MKVSEKILGVTLATTILAGAAFATGDRSERFKEADTNSNGVVTHDEMLSAVKVKFDQFDKDGDGYLTLSELPKEMPVPEGMEKRMEKHLERMAKRAEKAGRDFDEDQFEGRYKPTRMRFIVKLDRDNDERVSLEEFSSRAVHMFKRADENGDGEVTRTEMEDAGKHRHFGKKGGWHDRGGKHR
ncbi:EF-hand domain-containing protein [Kordiimonas aestuarii]|uniref:EF-hand domain-containing protein n=1 Tax=Kordiimonas aestuarii TaxID=1005925 RepID=UPI0021D296F2|nr:EF-hand domain-containing protein [Kordiimonas aestuarii]